MSEWNTTTLGDHVDLLTGFAFKSKEFTDKPGIRLARGDNVKRGYFDWGEGNAKYWPELTDELRPYLLNAGDVLIGMDGSRVGQNWARVTEADLPCLLVQRVARLRARPTLDPRFLRFLVGSPPFAAYVKAVHTGTSIPHISGSQIKQFQICLPPLREQQAIACILGALDDKIELNRRRCKTLEAMARAIFQSWFVDFDPVQAKAAGRTPAGLSPALAALFPDRFEDSPLGPIPAGWRVGTLGEVAEIRGGKQLPTEECLQNARYVVFGANGIMGYSTQSTHNGFVIAFGRVGAYCGSVHWSLDGAWINNNASSVRPFKWPAFVLQSMLEVDFTTMRTGSAQPFIPNSSLAAASIVLPEPKVADAYEVVAFPMRHKQASLRTESRTLAALRDALLPKLISGELRVPDVERIVGRAT